MTKKAVVAQGNPLESLKDPSLLRTEGLINGQWRATSHLFDVTDPATGECLARVANLLADDAQDAIKAANAAWPAWREKSAKERSTILDALVPPAH